MKILIIQFNAFNDKKNTFYKATLITSSKTIRQKKFSNKYSSYIQVKRDKADGKKEENETRQKLVAYKSEIVNQ